MPFIHHAAISQTDCENTFLRPRFPMLCTLCLLFIIIMLSFPLPISRKLYTIRPQSPQKLKLLITVRHGSADTAVRLSTTMTIFQGHMKFLVNCAWYCKSYYRLIIGNHTLAFDWCHFWWPWSTFEGNFSLCCHLRVQYLRNYTSYVHSYWNCL